MSKVITLIGLFAVFHSSVNSKTVLLTGSAGFIGSNFLEYMIEAHPEYNYIVLDALTYAGSKENIPSHILTSDRFRFVQGSVVDDLLVDELMKEAHLVVHFAAETHVTRSIADDLPFYETDFLGTRAMLKALVKHADTVERFIHISTSEVYGTAESEPMDETHPLNPRSPYAVTKAGADRLVYAYMCMYDIPAVIIRPFNNYGPRQHLEKLIPRFIAASIEDEPLTIHGTGEQKRDWIHTRDLAIALDLVLHHPDFSGIRGKEINIGSGHSKSVLEIGHAILKYFDLPESRIQFIPDRPGQVDCHIADISKAKQLLGWEPSIDFESGLKDTIEWYLKHPDHWQRMKEDSIVPITISGETVEL